ncbi:hypothetical protein Pelo_19689 [Pelomyxa schiedti]|nr:hypothetical protein Pelo_19689 [Pelomyxa schiedti]
MLRASMPVMKFEKLTPNGVSETPQMVSAFVGIDDATTANAALYKAETAGVPPDFGTMLPVPIHVGSKHC